jgi:hypothetical protein
VELEDAPGCCSGSRFIPDRERFGFETACESKNVYPAVKKAPDTRHRWLGKPVLYRHWGGSWDYL